MEVKHVSATSLQTYKACPVRYRIGYVEGIRLAEDPPPFRMGTAWHRGLEVLEMIAGTLVGDVAITEDNRLEIAVTEATAVYQDIPAWADATEWAVEREIVANALAAYHWLYGTGSEYETVATELQFELPLVNPETGHATPNFVRVGKIDRIVRHKGTGRLMIQEYKSTSKPIDSGSTYWDRLRKDTQLKFYINAARDLQEKDPGTSEIGIGSLSGLLHDVFHKPTIKPSKLTMGESAEFVKTGDYCGQKFDVVTPSEIAELTCPSIIVDGVLVEVESGKKEGTFALRETPGMFGARLLQDMTQRPEFYFARREIAFTDAELEDFRYQVWALQKTIAEMTNSGHWFENEAQCEATFKCAYGPICYQNVDVFHGATPPGFKRLHAAEAEQTEATVE
jgi:hypothetical protein